MKTTTVTTTQLRQQAKVLFNAAQKLYAASKGNPNTSEYRQGAELATASNHLTNAANCIDTAAIL